MAPVPRSLSAGQAPDPRPPRALFVLLVEARETFADLAAVADDATRPPARRKLARAGLAWILSVDLAAVTSEPSPAPRFEAWAE